jgi:hypothetical protein
MQRLLRSIHTSRLAGTNLQQARFWTICETLDNIPLSFTKGLARAKGSQDRVRKTPTEGPVLQIPYNGLESFLEIERVLRRAIGSQAENVGLHMRLLNEEPCEFGSA